MIVQGRLEEAEAVAASYGRKMIVKLEEKIRMLEAELGTTQIRYIIILIIDPNNNKRMSLCIM